MNIAIIGAGNLAHHLAPALQNAKHTVVQVFSRSLESASELALRLNTSYTNDLNEISKDADLYIFAVSDKAIQPICEALHQLNFFRSENQILVHTAGSVALTVFEPYSKNFGVLYPLQSFSKQRVINFEEIPLFYESNSMETDSVLKKIAMSVSSNVSFLNSHQRKRVHLSAIFVNNFVNHLFTISNELLTENNLDFALLMPLIHETVEKALTNNPLDMQTGPAVRADKQVMANHIEMLKTKPLWQKIYTFVSESIYESNQSHKNITQ